MTSHRTLNALQLACAGWLLAGCSLQPTYVRPHVDVGASYPAGVAQQTAPGVAGAGDIGWRDFIQDARLQSLIEIALRNNQDLRIAILNVDAARAQFQISRSQLLPAASLEARSTRQSNTGTASTAVSDAQGGYAVGVNLAWELDLFGRVRSLSDAVLAQYLALAETRKAVEIALIAEVAVQYLAMLGDEDQLRVTQATLVNAQESHRIARLNFEQGVATELDLHQSQGILEQASANLEAYARARAQVENGLVMLIGQSLPADLPAGQTLSTQNLMPDIPAGLPSDLLQRRPDIAAAEQSLIAANANIGAARAAFFPSISLTGSYGSLSPTTSGLFGSGSESWSFAPAITVPIFTGGRNVAQLERTEIVKRIEVANYEKTIRRAFREVADGLVARGSYDRQIQSLTRYQQTQERRLLLSTMRYKNGVDDYLAVLQAQTDLYAAQQNLVAVRVAQAGNLVMLYKALGGGWIARSGEPARAATVALEG